MVGTCLQKCKHKYRLFRKHKIQKFILCVMFANTSRYNETLCNYIGIETKPKRLVSSYRPISLLPTLGKMFEKLLLKRLIPIINGKNIHPKSQFGIYSHHNIIHQIHYVTDKIANSLENKNSVLEFFLDKAQAFD